MRVRAVLLSARLSVESEHTKVGVHGIGMTDSSMDFQFHCGGHTVAKKGRKLDLSELGEAPGLPGLTPEMGRCYANAAGVCSEANRHKQGVELRVQVGIAERRYTLNWPQVTVQIRRTHADLQDATADGAYAIAIMLAREITGCTVVEQAWKGTGIDYWLAESEDEMFQGARLEVSGILRGDNRDVARRIASKLAQISQSDDSGLPAYVCVVEFSEPEAHFRKQ